MANEVKVKYVFEDGVSQPADKAANNVDKSNKKMKDSAKESQNAFKKLGEEAKQAAFLIGTLRILGDAAKKADDFASVQKKLSETTNELQRQIGNALMPTIKDLLVSFDQLSTGGQGLANIIGGSISGALGGLKMVATGLFTVMEYIVQAMEGWVLLIGKIPDKFLPKGWAEGIDDFAASLDNLRTTLKDAGEMMASDAVAQFQQAGAILGGSTAAPPPKPKGKGKKEEAKAGQPKPPEDLSAFFEASQKAYADYTNFQVDMMEEGIEKQWALIEVNKENQIAALYEMNENMLISTEQFEADKQAIIDRAEQEKIEKGKEYGQKEIEREKMVASMKLSAASQFFGGFAALLSVAGKKSKEAAIAAKALAITQAVIDTAAGAIKAYNSMLSIPVAGPALGAVAAAGTIAFGIAQIATIASAKFAQGGIIPGNSYTGDRVPVRANSGEMILNQNQQGRLWGMLNGGGGGSQITIGGDNIVINGNADQATVKAIQRTREQQLIEMKQMLKELKYSGVPI